MAFGVLVRAEKLVSGRFEALWLSEKSGVVLKLLQEAIGRTLVPYRIQD